MELKDDYEHSNNSIFYTAENITSKSLYDEQIHDGCACEAQCELETCSCLKKSGAKYFRSNHSGDIYSSYFIEDTGTNSPIFECNSSCKCLDVVCGNRLVQYGPRKNLKIIPAGKKGEGLTTTIPIQKGNFICEYAGEVISEDEANIRYESNKRLGKMNYVFYINEHFGEKNYKTYIDPSVFGNIGRYINHSCEPNCGLYLIRVEHFTPKLCIFAKTNIEMYDEITFDYGNQNSVVDTVTDRIACLCNAETCRRYLPYYPQL